MDGGGKRWKWKRSSRFGMKAAGSGGAEREEEEIDGSRDASLNRK
jgi:hypothetical protein